MTRRAGAATLVILGGTAIGLGIVAGTKAQASAPTALATSAQGDQQPQCSTASLKGSFGVTATGTVAKVGPVAAVVRETFDGKGGITGVGTENGNGTIVHTTFTGTYTIKPDCTGTYVLNSTDRVEHNELVIDQEGQEFRAIVAEPGTTITAVGRKQFP